jgi:hypothetical protein
LAAANAHIGELAIDGAGVEDSELIAEAVRISGEVQQWGDRLVLRADPDSYQRLP